MLQNIARLASSRSKNPQESAHDAFLSLLDVVNVTVNCHFTPG